MPSPVKKGFYRRAGGAFVKVKGRYKKVGGGKYPKLVHYSHRSIPQDKKRRAKKSWKKRYYPQEYD
jgi:hypothetical protein